MARDDKLGKLRSELEELPEVSSISTLCDNGVRQVLLMPVRSGNAVDIWKYCRRKFDKTGFWPVASYQHSFFHLEQWGIKPEQELSTTIQMGELFDWRNWFLHEQDIWKRGLGEEGYDLDKKGRHGEWPLESKSWYKSLPMDPPRGDICILLVEARKFWHVPAILKMDWLGWGANREPQPDVHVGVLKYLQGAYGAELTIIESDRYVVDVARRPSTREEALQLAFGFDLYAYDLIDEVVDSFEKLAVTLMSNSAWYFWWD